MIRPTNIPAIYFPPDKGMYEVKPGLSSLQTGFGNSQPDAQFFQLDNQFHTYRENKLKARDESIEKYFCMQPGKDLSVINQFIINTLCNEHSAFFSFNTESGQLDCQLTGERLVFNEDYGINLKKSLTQVNTPYLNSFDALAMQVQEDFVVMEIDKSGEGKIIALHLCAPNHWAAQDKLGKDFIDIHQPVPGMERIYQRHREINKACLEKGPFVRFAWGLSTDKYLNHHPQVPRGMTDQDWAGRKFDPSQPVLFMRTERQTIQGFKSQRLVLFTIRTYFYDVSTLKRQQRQLLLEAIDSMSDATVHYKGIATSKNDICHWLRSSL